MEIFFKKMQLKTNLSLQYWKVISSIYQNTRRLHQRHPNQILTRALYMMKCLDVNFSGKKCNREREEKKKIKGGGTETGLVQLGN